MTVYMLGLDGASLNTIQESLGRTALPNFEKLLRDGKSAELRSVYPYVTAPAWTTLFSGVNPGKHGIFDMFEISGGKIIPSNMRATDVPFLWDYLSWANKRALVIGVPFVHPAPKINGVFVTGRFASPLSCYPEDVAKKFDLSGFQYDDLSMEEKTEKLVTKGSDNVSKRILGDLEKRANAIAAMIDSEEWDAVIAVEGLPDDLLHISYGDNAIVDKMYQALDRLVGSILQRMRNGDSLIIFSDHGFRKVEKVLFMNEWLGSKGYAKEVRESSLTKILYALGISWDSLSKPGLMSKVYRFVLAHFPWLLSKTKGCLRESMLVDKISQLESSRVSAFSINEPVAWLRIRDKSEISVDSLVAGLDELKRDGLLKNVFVTDKIFQGKYVGHEPGEILVEASDGWLIDTARWNNRRVTGKPLFTKKGVHKREGILLYYGSDTLNMPKLNDARVHDLVPTVMSLMKLPQPKSLDGVSLIAEDKSPVIVLDVAKRF